MWTQPKINVDGAEGDYDENFALKTTKIENNWCGPCVGKRICHTLNTAMGENTKHGDKICGKDETCLDLPSDDRVKLWYTTTTTTLFWLCIRQRRQQRQSFFSSKS